MAKSYETLGQYLVHSVLPEGYTFDKPVVDKKVMITGLANLATTAPEKYVDAVTKLKKIGDEISTYEGISVGLDDLMPDTEKRDEIVTRYFDKVRAAKTTVAKQELLLKAQDELLDLTKKHPGDMALMARSGGRGNIAQLMRTVTTPLMAQDWDDNIIPWMIKRSFSEGLQPSEMWVTQGEARKNTIMGTTSVVEPGALGKVVIQTMYDQVVSMDDCGTKNGLAMEVCDSSILDRYVAQPLGNFIRNTLVTPQIADALCKKGGKVVVRSPMTCEAKDGLCSKCYGLNSSGNPVKLGKNIGVASAHAISEPLTQALLSSKHAAGVAKGDVKEPRGFEGVKLLMSVPETFANAAVLAKDEGTVQEIKEAPQGGHYMKFNEEQYYIPPDIMPLAKVGARLEPGDRLSTGVPKPNDIMALKGLGIGRQYYTNALHKVFKNSIRDIDRRHFEVLAKAQLSHAMIEEDPEHKLLRSETIHFNDLRARLKENTEVVPLKDAKGRMLADSYYEYMAGTTLTPNMMDELKQLNIKEVEVAINPVQVSFLMKPVTHAPLLSNDWMARLAHQYLGKTLKDGASYGWKTNIHSYHPIPAFAHGTEFGKGSAGAY